MKKKKRTVVVNVNVIDQNGETIRPRDCEMQEKHIYHERMRIELQSIARTG